MVLYYVFIFLGFAFLVLGIEYPIHVYLQMRFYMLHFFCNGIREILSLLLHLGQILNESSFRVSSDAE
jgi:hypothetical protein